VAGIGLGKVAFLLLLVVFYVLLGIFLDGLALVVLTVPILLPILIALDVNLIWFGVFVIFLAELGVISPPIGMLIYVVHNLAQDPTINLGRRVSIGDVFKGLIPFCVSVVVIVVILIAWPDLALWLPMASSN
ncbi:MAG: TRAP transporter large permease subunit, partial [Mycetocola sp.]